MVFLKTCFECGNKVKKLFDGLCEDCFKQYFPPVKEVKQVTFRIDNVSKKVKYNNYFYQKEKIEEMLPEIMRKRVVMNKNYKLNSVDIENFEIDGHKLKFDLIVDSDFI